MANAKRIIGAGKAKASAAARKKNPRLNRTGGHSAMAKSVAKNLYGERGTVGASSAYRAAGDYFGGTA